MRYFSYDEPAETETGIPVTGNRTVTLSEEEIRNTYYPNWYKLMCNKYSKDYVDSTFCFEDCLDDWIVVHYARQVND